jgi:hypothetical protein
LVYFVKKHLAIVYTYVPTHWSRISTYVCTYVGLNSWSHNLAFVAIKKFLLRSQVGNPSFEEVCVSHLQEIQHAEESQSSGVTRLGKLSPLWAIFFDVGRIFYEKYRTKWFGRIFFHPKFT